MFQGFNRSLAFALAASAASMAIAQAPVKPENMMSSAYSYSDIADLALAAQTVAKVKIKRATLLDQASFPASNSASRTVLVNADVITLIRGEAGLPAKIRYIAEVNLADANHLSGLKKKEVLVAATPAPGTADVIRLVAPYGQLGWTAERENLFRIIISESLAAAAPPIITSVGDAFHVPGVLPGESETQIFLKTVDSRPVSLSVMRRPQENPQWYLSLGEIVGDAISPPSSNTLLWYRLACSLPDILPSTSVKELPSDAAAAAAADYRLIREQLGPCIRKKGQA